MPPSSSLGAPLGAGSTFSSEPEACISLSIWDTGSTEHQNVGLFFFLRQIRKLVAFCPCTLFLKPCSAGSEHLWACSWNPNAAMADSEWAPTPDLEVASGILEGIKFAISI